ncbi:hypothetical protein L6164_010253 [Bauhinia variegata]|uniref:Uncharacterized protein n=1 Tax=Bauhinia variegata TaxID=167791 RepID=A0ACB9PMJ4_BAUVA|nr:hypothetical protein L6164_010253 [Bauhinia variegata]
MFMINGGGGGITGLVVLGGALVITGLMAAFAVFATNKNKKKGLGLESQMPQESDNSGSKTEDKEVETTQGQGLRFILHDDEDSTTNANACCATYATPEISMNQINSTHSLPTQTSILEEKPGLKTSNEESPICFRHETVFSDDFHPGSAVLPNDNVVEEDMDENESEVGHKLKDITEAQSENATTEAETQADMDDEEEFDGSLGSSEATERTSMDSNEEPIWPAGLIEEPQKEFKEKIVNLQIPQEELEKAAAIPETDHSESDSNLSTEVDTDSSKSDSSNCVGEYDYRDMTRETEVNHKTKFYAALNDHDGPSVKVSHPSNLRIWIASLLLLALLFFLLFVFTSRYRDIFRASAGRLSNLSQFGPDK